MTTRPCGLRRAGNNSKSTIYNSPQHGKAITRARLELVFWSTDICHSAVGGGGYRIRRAVGLQLMSTCGLIAWQLTGRVRAVSDALLGEATRSKATVCRPCGVLLGQAWPAGHLLTSSRGRARAWDVCVCVCVCVPHASPSRLRVTCHSITVNLLGTATSDRRDNGRWCSLCATLFWRPFFYADKYQNWTFDLIQK